MSRGWTDEETAYLLRQAGLMPVEDIADALGKSPESVRQKAKRLRKIDRAASLRLRRICPSCGHERSLWALKGKGVCRVCEKSAQLHGIESRMADLLSSLPPEQRDRYAVTESIRESEPLPRPKPKRTAGMSPERKAKAKRDHEKAIEAWEIGCLQRRIKAAQKRKERMEKKCRNVGNDTLPDQDRNSNG